MYDPNKMKKVVTEKVRYNVKVSVSASDKAVCERVSEYYAEGT